MVLQGYLSCVWGWRQATVSTWRGWSCRSGVCTRDHRTGGSAAPLALHLENFVQSTWIWSLGENSGRQFFPLFRLLVLRRFVRDRVRFSNLIQIFPSVCLGIRLYCNVISAPAVACHCNNPCSLQGCIVCCRILCRLLSIIHLLLFSLFVVAIAVLNTAQTVRLTVLLFWPTPSNSKIWNWRKLELIRPIWEVANVEFEQCRKHCTYGRHSIVSFPWRNWITLWCEHSAWWYMTYIQHDELTGCLFPNDWLLELHVVSCWRKLAWKGCCWERCTERAYYNIRERWYLVRNPSSGRGCVYLCFLFLHIEFVFH